ncbi:unnamed protein product [Blepharisma stoltei]|uniref:RING-type domain-containing protein n=1 Tax=Blepharisma stoltei TaxID=1481888 RepID=A0AAU9ISA7_9CILI|nr:unnamed protein product [Blepharisma stoltei]
MDNSSKNTHSLEVMNCAPENEMDETDGIFVNSAAPITSEILFQLAKDFHTQVAQQKIENSGEIRESRPNFRDRTAKESAFFSKNSRILKNKQKIKNFNLPIDKLEFRLSELTDDFRCGLCGGALRRSFMLLGCYHNFCKICLARWLKEGNKKCPCGRDIKSYVPNRILQFLTYFVLYHFPAFSPRLSKANDFLRCFESFSETEVCEKQKELFNYRKTTIFQVITGDQAFGFETSGEFCIKDIYDLILRKISVEGNIVCKGKVLEENLMVGFIDAFIWREPQVLTLSLLKN